MKGSWKGLTNFTPPGLGKRSVVNREKRWLDKIQLIFAKDGETLTLECHVSKETGCFAMHNFNKGDFKTEKPTHTEDYCYTKSFSLSNTAQKRGRYVVFAEPTAEKMKTMLASHTFVVDNSYFPSQA
ncbi:hypothetical protein HGM15179_006344 [Zosterops borbonicus]|uniref:Uncharacterized protein n=1 Tax=Zosterops borbonicus TaxID=364589 RepID=A0A8K1LP81_9PASS|nr:hypothetical protein HGM15179_006344 [Zosterops borbonicus]